LEPEDFVINENGVNESRYPNRKSHTSVLLWAARENRLTHFLLIQVL